MDSVRLMKIVKVALILVALYFITSSFFNWLVEDSKEIKELIKEKWELISYQGVAFFPIHLLPKKIRKFFIPFDTLICNSIFREFSSHIIYVLKRK